MCVRARAKGERSRLTLDAMKNVLLLLTRGHRFSLSLNERSIDLVVNCFCTNNTKEKCCSLLSRFFKNCALFSFFVFAFAFHKTCFPRSRRPSATHKIYTNNNVSKLTVVVVSKDFSARREQRREQFRFHE